jgi:hypothetical protein
MLSNAEQALLLLLVVELDAELDGVPLPDEAAAVMAQLSELVTEIEKDL